MPMDDHTQKVLIVFLAKQLKENWKDLIAHKSVLEVLREHGHHAALDELLESARKSVELDSEFRVYCSTLEQIMPPEWEALDAETQRWMEMFPGSERPN